MSKDLLDQLQRHRSYDQFLQYEQNQRTQEELRRYFKPPLGRDPPLRLSMPEPTWKSSRQFLSPRASARPALRTGKEPKLQFTKDFWETVKASCKGEEPRLPTKLDPLPRVTSLSVPEFNTASVTDSFQYAVPASSDYSDFNPFLRPYAHNHFFPLTFFFMDEADYSKIEFPALGYSRWRGTDETWEWRKCVVETYDPRERLFTITWEDTTVSKKVSRVNLRFEHEREDDFLSHLTEATHRRDLQEAMLRCEHRVEFTLSNYPEIRLTPETESRIISGLRKYLTPSSEVSILQEIEDYYRRSVVNFVFEIEHFFPKWQLTIQ